MAERTDNAFLGGQLQILQPATGYRAGMDPVLLAAACCPRVGGRVLELGCGVGTALFCLARRRPDLRLSGVEINGAYAALARENAARNGIEARILEGDVAALPHALRQESFDLILANPPYFDRNSSVACRDQGREAGRGEGAPLSVWVHSAAKRLAPKGQAVFIQRMARLPELLSACAGRLGSVVVTPLVPRRGQNAHLAILSATKNGRAEFRLASEIALHCSTALGCNERKYSPEIEAVLRNGAALSEF